VNIIKKIKGMFSGSDHNRRFLAGEPLISSKKMVNSDLSMTYSAVFGCVRVLGETLASTPILLYKKLKNGDRELKNDLDIYFNPHHNHSFRIMAERHP